MKKTKKKNARKERLPDRASELLINHRILWAVRDELKANIRSHDKRFESIDKRFESIDKKFESTDEKIDSAVNKISAEIYEVRSDVQRVIALVEEQNNRKSSS